MITERTTNVKTTNNESIGVKMELERAILCQIGYTKYIYVYPSIVVNEHSNRGNSVKQGGVTA